MRASFLLLLLLLCSGCKHIGVLFEPPGTLKAVIQGVVKGVNIHCEKTLSLGTGSWEVMCKVSDEMDIKYRTQSLEGGQTKLEILIDKDKGLHRKVIASPVVIIGRNKQASLRTVDDLSDIEIKAERVR